MTDEATRPAAAPEGWYIMRGRRLYWTGSVWEAINGRTPNLPPPVVTDGPDALETPAPASGWYRVDGAMRYWDGEQWLNSAGEVVPGGAPDIPQRAAAPAGPNVALAVFGVGAILFGLLLLLVLPQAPALLAFSLSLVFVGTLVTSAWYVVRHLYLLRALPKP